LRQKGVPMLRLFIFIFFIINLGGAYADSYKMRETIGQFANTDTSANFSVSYDSANWAYREYRKDDSIFMKDSGTLQGIKFAGAYSLNEHFLVEGYFKTLSGNTRYRGGLQNSFGDHMGAYESDSKNKLKQYEVNIGYVAESGPSLFFITSLGLNHRTLKNPQQEADPYDYTREATYKTTPIKLKTVYWPTTSLSLDATINYALSFSGETFTKGSDVGDRDVTFQQASGQNYGFELGSTYLTSYGEIVFSLYADFWSVKDSNFIPDPDLPGYGSLEPKNKTEMYGLNLGFRL
jgi:hypothetical protein